MLSDVLRKFYRKDMENEIEYLTKEIDNCSPRTVHNFHSTERAIRLAKEKHAIDTEEYMRKTEHLKKLRITFSAKCVCENA